MECLASVFAVDVLVHAILSNHMHQILRNRPDVVKTWSDEQVAIRWLKVFPGRRIEEQLADPTDVDVKQLWTSNSCVLIKHASKKFGFGCPTCLGS